MKVLISGCGKIGTAIIESLIKENHQIAVFVEKLSSRQKVHKKPCKNAKQNQKEK